jgi:hypothetical protein
MPVGFLLSGKVNFCSSQGAMVDRTLRYTLPLSILSGALLIGSMSGVSDPVVVNVEFPELVAPVVNVTQEPPVVNVEVLPAVVNVAPPVVSRDPVTVVVEPAPVLPPQTVYRDRVVETVVEVRSCLDYGMLPEFDLSNALSVGFPDAQWSQNGPHYSGLQWLDDSPQPTFTQIIGAWLSHLAEVC